MTEERPECEFLTRKNMHIQHIGIYELDWLVDENQLVCQGILVAFDDRTYLVESRAVGEDQFTFSYHIYSRPYNGRKIVGSADSPLRFVGKEEKEGTYEALRFSIGDRPVLVTADDDGLLTVGIFQWNEEGNWLEFENNVLLNDR